MNDKEIIERLIQMDEEMREQFDKEIRNIENLIIKRVKNNDFDIIDLILQRKMFISRKNEHYSMPGTVEALRDE